MKRKLLPYETRDGAIEALSLEVVRLSNELKREVHDESETTRIKGVITDLNRKINALKRRKKA